MTLVDFSRWLVQARHRIVLLWLLLFVGALTYLALSSKDTMETELTGATYTEAYQVKQILAQEFQIRLGSSAALVVLGQKSPQELLVALPKAFPQIAQITPIQSPKSHHHQLLYITFKPDYKVVQTEALTKELRTYLKNWEKTNGFKIYLTGHTGFQYDAKTAGKKDSLRSEALALLLSLLVLIYTFRSFTTALLPLLMGVTTLVFLRAVLLLCNISTNPMSQILTGLVGLALAIDYSLFMVSRFREEVAQGKSEPEALQIMLSYAGKTIIFSALIMLCSISALLIPDVSLSRTLVINLLLVIGLSLVNCTLFLPAFLMTGKHWLDRPRFLANWLKKTNTYPYWKAFSQHVAQQAKLYFLLSLFLLLGLAWPARTMLLWSPVQGIAPKDTESMQGYRLLQDDGWGGELLPITLVVKAHQHGEVYQPDFIAYLYALQQALDKLPAVASVQSLIAFNPTFSLAEHQNLFNSMGALRLMTRSNPLLDQNEQLTLVQIHPRNLKNQDDADHILQFTRQYAKTHPQYAVLTGGVLARVNDFTYELYRYVPHMLTIIFISIYLLLFYYMKSLLLPLKAGIMNFLPILSAYGLLTLIFQYGYGHEWLGTPINGAVSNVVPVLLFCVIFGLSMDYEVLILSRITEAYEQSRHVQTAVVEGLARSGSTITGAVLILLGVFIPGIFSFSPQTQEICLGITAAIVLDATVVRLFLVPSFMMLMGHWNWWSPWSRKRS